MQSASPLQGCPDLQDNKECICRRTFAPFEQDDGSPSPTTYLTSWQFQEPHQLLIILKLRRCLVSRRSRLRELDFQLLLPLVYTQDSHGYRSIRAFYVQIRLRLVLFGLGDLHRSLRKPCLRGTHARCISIVTRTMSDVAYGSLQRKHFDRASSVAQRSKISPAGITISPLAKHHPRAHPLSADHSSISAMAPTIISTVSY